MTATWLPMPQDPGWYWVRCSNLTRIALILPARVVKDAPGVVRVFWDDGEASVWRLDELPHETRWLRIERPA